MKPLPIVSNLTKFNQSSRFAVRIFSLLRIGLRAQIRWLSGSRLYRRWAVSVRIAQREREKRFEQLSSAIGKALKVKSVKSAVLDGEIVALNESGLPAFYHLMRRKCHAVYYAFDVLWLDGKDLRALPLLERKKILRSILPQKSSWIGYVSFIGHTRAKRLFELVKAKDLEGLVAKRKDGKYAAAARWFKVLNPTYSQKTGRQEFFEETN
jgi:ATP-dependent DNA ligase